MHLNPVTIKKTRKYAHLYVNVVTNRNYYNAGNALKLTEGLHSESETVTITGIQYTTSLYMCICCQQRATYTHSTIASSTAAELLPLGRPLEAVQSLLEAVQVERAAARLTAPRGSQLGLGLGTREGGLQRREETASVYSTFQVHNQYSICRVARGKNGCRMCPVQNHTFRTLL